MFNGVEYVREVCQQRKIPVSVLEKECGFSNGYLKPRKLQKIPYERALKIANYLNLSVDFLLTGEQKETAPVLTKKDERDIEKRLEAVLEDLENSQGGLVFSGEPLDEVTRELLAESLRNSMRIGKTLAKQKFTPKKYRKD